MIILKNIDHAILQMALKAHLQNFNGRREERIRLGENTIEADMIIKMTTETLVKVETLYEASM